MTDKQFDDFIRARLKDHSAPVPPGLWEKIRPADKDDRKGFILPKINRFGYLAIAALLVAIGVGGYLYFNGGQEKELPSANTAITTQSNTTAAGNSNNKNNTSHSSVTASATGDAHTKENNQEQQENISTPNTLNSNNTNSTASSLPITRNRSSVIMDNNTSFVPPFNTTTAAASNQYTTTTASQENNEAAADVSIPSYNNHFNLLTAAAIPTSRNALLFDMKNIQELELASAIAHTKRVPNIVVCPSSRGGGAMLNPDWYIEAYASPDIAVKSIQNISATPQYMQRKDSSESMQVGYSAGFRIVKPFDDHFLLKAGLQYAQVNEKFVYRSENEIKTTTVVTVRQIIRGPGDTVLVRDTSVLQQIGYRNKTVHNRYSSIDLPLTVGYQFGTDDDDFRVGVNAGVVINLSSWYQGVILDSSLTAVPVNKSSNSMIYKSNIGLGLYGSISLMKRLNENTHLFFEPYFRYNLSSMTNAQASYNQKFSIGGLAIGLRFNLNRR
jgi:hypothetical protein